MATLTIRHLDEKTKTRLRVRVAHHERSMEEEEAREILRSALSSVSPTKVGTMMGANDLFIAAHAKATPRRALVICSASFETGEASGGEKCAD